MSLSTPPPPPPAVILLGTQLGENIGTTARAMHNFGLSDLRLVAPREGWSHAKAHAAAAGGGEIVARSRLYDSLEAGLAGLDYVVAATARPRDMNKEVHTPEEIAVLLRAHERVGILFGPERSGLDNESISLCDTIVEIPANPNFSSLNLAQAVLLICYQYYRAGSQIAAPAPSLAAKEELLYLFTHLEQELEEASFFRSAAKRPTMVRNLRNIFHRARLSTSEVKALRGVITALVEGRGKRKKD